jgi:1,4-alpha-glucan branching enzyme
MIKTTKKLKNTATKPAETPVVPVAPAATKKVVSAALIEAKSTPVRTNQVSLELVKPGAKTVYVAGSFNEWKPENTPLAPAGNGRWVGDVTIKPGRHEYLFVVDGQWLPDPNAKETVQNPFGGRNSVLQVNG